MFGHRDENLVCLINGIAPQYYRMSFVDLHSKRVGVKVV